MIFNKKIRITTFALKMLFTWEPNYIHFLDCSIVYAIYKNRQSQ